MSSRRVLKAAEAIREVVSMAILVELRDPRISDVTVTYVEVAGDMRQAKVHVSVMGDEVKQTLCLHGLQNSAGFLQQNQEETPLALSGLFIGRAVALAALLTLAATKSHAIHWILLAGFVAAIIAISFIAVPQL